MHRLIKRKDMISREEYEDMLMEAIEKGKLTEDEAKEEMQWYDLDERVRDENV